MDSKGTSLKMVSAKGTETSDNKKKKLKNKQTQNRLRIHPDSNPLINYLMLYRVTEKNAIDLCQIFTQIIKEMAIESKRSSNLLILHPTDAETDFHIFVRGGG
jgi:hypothetical protein